MKNILSGAVAAIALVAISAPAAAQTNTRHYAGPNTLFSSSPWTISTPTPYGPLVDGAAVVLGEVRLALDLGTRYTAEASAPNSTGTVQDTVEVAFNLSGTVSKDCSFYAGNNSSALDIDFGNIGIRAGNNENVSNAFEMVGPAVANIETMTAGCNFNNEVKIQKDDVRGLVNNNPGTYTSDFTAQIPYSVTATWQGIPLGGSEQSQTLNVTTTQDQKALLQGAWRSSMTIDIVAPVVPNKGLVAGTYEGVTTLTLTAL